MTEGRPARDEGAAQTAQIIAAVKRRRAELGWSAKQLAEEMAKAGIPWNADIVVNLEHGKRRSLRVHEALALAFVMDFASPLDLIVPPRRVTGSGLYPLTPGGMVDTASVRKWFAGETGPLRSYLQAVDGLEETGFLADIRKMLEEHVEVGTLTSSAADVLARDIGAVAASGSTQFSLDEPTLGKQLARLARAYRDEGDGDGEG